MSAVAGIVCNGPDGGKCGESYFFAVAKDDPDTVVVFDDAQSERFRFRRGEKVLRMCACGMPFVFSFDKGPHIEALVPNRREDWTYTVAPLDPIETVCPWCGEAVVSDTAGLLMNGRAIWRFDDAAPVMDVCDGCGGRVIVGGQPSDEPNERKLYIIFVPNLVARPSR